MNHVIIPFKKYIKLLSHSLHTACDTTEKPNFENKTDKVNQLSVYLSLWHRSLTKTNIVCIFLAIN